MNRGKTVSVPGAPSPEQPRQPVGVFAHIPRRDGQFERCREWT
jgi:hypothetical protein